MYSLRFTNVLITTYQNNRNWFNSQKILVPISSMYGLLWPGGLSPILFFAVLFLPEPWPIKELQSTVVINRNVPILILFVFLRKSCRISISSTGFSPPLWCKSHRILFWEKVFLGDLAMPCVKFTNLGWNRLRK